MGLQMGKLPVLSYIVTLVLRIISKVNARRKLKPPLRTPHPFFSEKQGIFFLLQSFCSTLLGST